MIKAKKGAFKKLKWLIILVNHNCNAFARYHHFVFWPSISRWADQCLFFSYARFFLHTICKNFTQSSQNLNWFHQKYKRKWCFLCKKCKIFPLRGLKATQKERKPLIFTWRRKILHKMSNFFTQLSDEKKNTEQNHSQTRRYGTQNNFGDQIPHDGLELFV